MSSSFNAPWGHIEIHRLPTGGRAVKMDKVVLIDGVTVLLGHDGKLYCPKVRDNCSYTIGSWFGFSLGLMKGLVALGQITRKQADEYAEAAKKRDERSAAGYDLNKLDELAAQYGLKIAARERAKIAKAAGVEL